MRTIHRTKFISGIFNEPVAGLTINLAMPSGYPLVSAGDVVYNRTKETSGTVIAVIDNEVTTDVSFSVGDFYEIVLATEQALQTEDGIVYDVECKVCGFSFPSWELVDGICDTCLDEDRYGSP